MADVAVGFLLENLKQLLLYNVELIGGVKDRVGALYSDLIQFKAFLRDSTKQRSHNETLQAHVNEVRSVVDKAEDVMDIFVVEMTKFKERDAFRKVFHSVGHSVTIRKVAIEIESIRTEAKEIHERLRQFGFQGQQLEDRVATGNESPAVEEQNVVGFDGEAKIIIDLLTEEGEDLDIISIIGMPGLGKTTLARKIYNDPTIVKRFSTRSWVYVSQKYSKKEIFLSILSNLTQTTHLTSKSDAAAISEQLCKYLEKENYLIVIDDVWTIEAWDHLKSAFPNNKKGSRILITTRHKPVALHANPSKEPHPLKPLTIEKSWELLESKVFAKKKFPPGEVQMHGIQVAKECNGLPLALVVIAGILLNNRDLSDWWKEVALNIKSFIVTERVTEVVAWSYNHLPYHLKSCFLYLGVFPEDYVIPVWELICLWIAEGFIEEDGKRSLEDIAYSFLVDLVNRNLVMPVEMGSDSRIKTCHVHDMLYEFCKMEAGKQNFIQEINTIREETLDRLRRVCIHSGVVEYLSSEPYGEHVRSFLCFDLDKSTLLQKPISTIPKAFKLLRVLDIRCITFDIFPKDLLQLVLLRYIAIFCNIKTLTSSISKLWNVQTLILQTTSPTLQLEKGMWKMYQLRHLRTNASTMLPRPPSSTQKRRENMQSLSMISPESCTEHVFARTPKIKKLGVRGKLVVLFGNMFDNVGRLKNLTNLKLFNDVAHHPSSEGKTLDLPSALKFPTGLKKLTLSQTFLHWENMQTLGKLEKLEVLKLKDNAFNGTVWQPQEGGFLHLKFLHIGKTDLVTWEASEYHFPSLEHLVLQHCEKLEAVPSCFADIVSFQVLKLYYTNKNAAASAREIQLKKMTKEGQNTKTNGGLDLYIHPSDM